MSQNEPLQQGTTIGRGRDIVGIQRDKVFQIIEDGKEVIQRAKAQSKLPDVIQGPTAAILIAIAGYHGPLSETQWRELAGIVGGLMANPNYPDLAALRNLISYEHFNMVIKNPGYAGFITRLADGRWICEFNREAYFAERTRTQTS
jgi:hypothetical protein